WAAAGAAVCGCGSAVAGVCAAAALTRRNELSNVAVITRFIFGCTSAACGIAGVTGLRHRETLNPTRTAVGRARRPMRVFRLTIPGVRRPHRRCLLLHGLDPLLDHPSRVCPSGVAIPSPTGDTV